MKDSIKTREGYNPRLGKCLYANNGIIEIEIPEEIGFRITSFSFINGKNVFFEQPEEDNFFVSENGWRIYGGHRLWVAPESDKTYWPDNLPVSIEVLETEIIVTQPKDGYNNIIKSAKISFENNSLFIEHHVRNISEEPLKMSIWAVTSMAPGGTETVNMELRDGGMDPWTVISAWDYTSLSDPRATFKRDAITIRHLPLDERFKIGIGHPKSPVIYTNNGITFSKSFKVDRKAEYPDGGVSYETYFSKYMMEMESLSPLCVLGPGEETCHNEILSLSHI